MKNTLGHAIIKPTTLFKTLYAEAYKNHYEEIMEQIEAYAAYGTKIEKFSSYENIDAVFYIDTARIRWKSSRHTRNHLQAAPIRIRF